ncbi:DUF6292 family protein [Streptomyces sp. NPDC057854]|uniref:DUF6292 family protein n=1 Tax=unclassified Streptomyces TaxID=2593676 RepID=UPI0036A0AE18
MPGRRAGCGCRGGGRGRARGSRRRAGVARFPTAQAGLATLRGRRIADLVEADPALDPKEAARRLGYPTVTHRGAIANAEGELRARSAKPYLQHVADALAAAGAAPQAEVEVRRLDSGHLATAVLLEAGQPAPALVWDERFGWRTATSRRHPIGKPTHTAPEGEGDPLPGRRTTARTGGTARRPA